VNFSENLEKSLDRIGQGIKNNKIEIGRETEKREIVKQSIKQIAETESENLPKEEIEKSLKEDANLPSYLNVDTDEKIKKEVEKLITVVLKEGLEKGLKLAKKKSAFVEDAFHDALTEKLLPELEKRGII